MHVKEIPNTKLLVSLHHKWHSASLKIFEISKKAQPQRIYSLEEVSGDNIAIFLPANGDGDVTYNSRRSILGAFSARGKIAYHLFTVDISKTNEIVKLIRKSKWPSRHYDQERISPSSINGIDFDSSGELVATFDFHGDCLISDVNTNNCSYHLKTGSRDHEARCRWSSITGEPLLFVKYNKRYLTILDVEKQALTMKKPVQIQKQTPACWIDVFQSNGNLLAAADADTSIKILTNEY